MTYSVGSVIVCGEGSTNWGFGFVVVPDCGGESEDALQDAHDDFVGGVAAVSFQVELTFEGLVDRFNGLTQGFE